MQLPPSQKTRINYKLGSIYALVTALLLSVQEPFSFLAAKRLSFTQFVFLTQVALLMSLPLLIARERSRRELIVLLGNTANYCKLGVLFPIGMLGLLMFKLALSNAHPIIISAIINLQPFLLPWWRSSLRECRSQSRLRSSSAASSAGFSARWRLLGVRLARGTGRT